MSIRNTTIKKEKKQGKYHHLTKEQRVTIESRINQKEENGKRLFNSTYIANYLGVNKSTISRKFRKRRKEKRYIRTGKTKTIPYTIEYA